MKSEFRHIPLFQIDEGLRMRKDYKDVEGLALSIQEKGLIQPVAVIDKAVLPPDIETHGELDPEKPFLLIAGGRRFAAHQHLQRIGIDARVYTELTSEEDLREIELVENLQREDLHWTEEAALTREIILIQERRYGPSLMGSAGSGEAKKKTAEITGKSLSTVYRNDELAALMEANPEIKKAKTKKEAVKMAAKDEEKLILAELAKRAESQATTGGRNARLKSLTDGYIVSDFFKGIAKVEDESIDLFHVDPDYAIDVKSLKGAKSDTYTQVTVPEYPAHLRAILAEAMRVMKPATWGIMWYAIEPWHNTVLETIREAGFQTSGVPFIWTKGTGGSRSPHSTMGNGYEVALTFRKGGAQLITPGTLNHIHVPVSKESEHIAEKPIQVLQYLFQHHTVPGARILDGFLGSGNSIFAGQNLNMKVFGYDLSEDHRNEFLLRANQRVK